MLLQIVPLTTIMAAPSPNPAPLPLPLALAQPKQQKYHNTYLSNSLSKLLDDNLSIDPIKTSNSFNKLGSAINQKSTELYRRKKKVRTRSLDQSDMPWQNPCGGRYNGNINKPKTITIQTRRKAFKLLRDAIALDSYYALSGPIVISDIGDWSKTAEHYKYLASIKPTSNITLVRWHKKMQRYVGIISHLTKTQQRTHNNNRKFNDNDFRSELEHMFQASQKVLCAIETSINSTHNEHKIHTITQSEMNKYIQKLRTKDDYVDEIDLKIVKSKYLNITENMRKALNKKLSELSCKIQEKKNNSGTDYSGNVSSSLSSSSSSSSSYNKNNSINNSNSGSYYSSKSKENNSMSLSNNNNNNNNNNNSISKSKEKRLRKCQRTLNKQNNKRLNNNNSNNSNNENKNNRNRKSLILF